MHPNRSPNPGLVLINKKKSTHGLVDFAVDVENKRNVDKYLDLTREQKNLWNLRVTVILNTVGALEKILKGFVKKTGGFGYQRKNPYT